MEQRDRKLFKVEYVKPKILDLGPVTLVIGGTCEVGRTYYSECTPGASPYDFCAPTGLTATACSGGNNALT